MQNMVDFVSRVTHTVQQEGQEQDQSVIKLRQALNIYGCTKIRLNEHLKQDPLCKSVKRSLVREVSNMMHPY